MELYKPILAGIRIVYIGYVESPSLRKLVAGIEVPKNLGG
jgi:hypothetical protein